MGSFYVQCKIVAKRVEKQKTARREISSSQALGPGPAHPPITMPLEASVGVPLSDWSNSGPSKMEISPIYLSQQARGHTVW
jgi:hypothetical protein